MCTCHFSFLRLVQLLRNDVFLHRRSIFLFLLAAFGFLFLGDLLTILNNRAPVYHQYYYELILFSGGTWFSARVFAFLHRAEESYAFLMLPASALEKIGGKIIISSIGYLLFSFAVFYLFYLLAYGLAWLWRAPFYRLMNPFDLAFLKMIMAYLSLQSMVFAASLYFKKHPLVKLSLFLLIFLPILAVFAMLFLSLSFSYYPEAYYWKLLTLDSFSPHVNYFIKLIFWGILPLFCWVLSYFKFAEYELLA